MADFSLKIKAQQLGKSLENISKTIETELSTAVGNLAQAAYSSMISQMQKMSANPKNRAEYLSGLKFQYLGADSYIIYLEGDWANKLESGFPGYDMRQTLLKSTKTVSTGSRTGKPWVQTGAQGQKYAHVPFEHKPNSKQSGDMGADIRKIMVQNAQGLEQKITNVFKDIDGNPIIGKVAQVKEHANPNLVGLTKYQIPKKDGVSSVYMTFRTISELGKGFNHPGFSGYQLFQQAEKMVEAELENIIKTIIK